jgi:hypothetical protein
MASGPRWAKTFRGDLLGQLQYRGKSRDDGGSVSPSPFGTGRRVKRGPGGIHQDDVRHHHPAELHAGSPCRCQRQRESGNVAEAGRGGVGPEMKRPAVATSVLRNQSAATNRTGSADTSRAATAGRGRSRRRAPRPFVLGVADVAPHGHHLHRVRRKRLEQEVQLVLATGTATSPRLREFRQRDCRLQPEPLGDVLSQSDVPAKAAALVPQRRVKPLAGDD